MNALLIVGLVLAALLTIFYFWAAKKCYPKTRLYIFLAALALILVLLVALAQPPRMDSMQITYVKGNTVTLFDGRGNNLTLNLATFPHISTDYTTGMTVQLTRDILGTPIFLSPQDWTVLPKQR